MVRLKPVTFFWKVGLFKIGWKISKFIVTWVTFNKYCYNSSHPKFVIRENVNVFGSYNMSTETNVILPNQSASYNSAQAADCRDTSKLTNLELQLLLPLLCCPIGTQFSEIPLDELWLSVTAFVHLYSRFNYLCLTKLELYG